LSACGVNLPIDSSSLDQEHRMINLAKAACRGNSPEVNIVESARTSSLIINGIPCRFREIVSKAPILTFGAIAGTLQLRSD
jgi:hypothetical protein